MRIEIPELSLVTLIGASGSGKSTFSKKYFKPTEVLSSDYFRGIICDDENDQTISDDAFDALYYIARKRLKAGKLIVIDATNVQPKARAPIAEIASKYDYMLVAIVFDLPEDVCQQRNMSREDRQVEPYVIKKHIRHLKRSIKKLKEEGFKQIYVLKSEEEVNNSELIRTKLWNNKREIHGPFDIIGDIHGCYDELCQLLEKLGYVVDKENFLAHSPEGRKAVFLGDLTDRGPKSMEVLKLVMSMVKTENAYCVLGNHDGKLLRKLKGSDVKVIYGLEKTLEQMEKETPEFIDEVKMFLDNLISHYVFDEGRLVVAHAGLKEKFQGRASRRVKDFAMYGETTGETDEFGLPIRYDWADEYRGKAFVVYGHTPQQRVQFINNTVNIDTGCVFGGRLTALRYPEKEIVDVKAKDTYYESVRPLFTKENEGDDMLNIKDVLGKRHVITRFRQDVIVSEENTAAALEIMSRFAADPRWLIYLPPTMSPCETSAMDDVLEHPAECFNYYRDNDIDKVVCEQKHMGSRAVIVVCKDEEAAFRHFGVKDQTVGIIYTRTGRRFFNKVDEEQEVLKRFRLALDSSGFWDDFHTDWVILDTEIMPWSAKAMALLKEQYANVGRAGRVALNEAVRLLEEASKRQIASTHVDEGASGKNIEIEAILSRYKERETAINRYTSAYRGYCWQVNSIDDLRIAPFHILATEGVVHHDKNHIWHMDTIKKYMTHSDPMIIATNHIVVDVTDEEDINKGISWWEKLTSQGGEGMVVKPYEFIAWNDNKMLQPAMKCRGKEYLRIIYGPEYTLEDNLKRLKKRSLRKKRSLALREFALGMEGLERFVGKEPLYRVHECSFMVLALESEPVDPRL